MTLRVLLTGGSRGIGAEIKRIFLEKGHDVHAPDREELNLADPLSIENFEPADFDALVNCAGINDRDNLENIEIEKLMEILQVNFLSSFQLAKKITPYMKQAGRGWIVNVGSVWAVTSRTELYSYSSSKFALLGATKSLARELAPHNILVNILSPGFTDTELTQVSLSPEQLKKLLAEVPLGRLATPREVANWAYFLASDCNSFITGQNIIIDGGFTA